MNSKALFFIGQIIEHKLFNYRGVIIGVDDSMQLSEQWYQQVARSRPPKDKPWYHVLVNDQEQPTYVAEQNLTASQHPAPIKHPFLDHYFSNFKNDRYLLHSKIFH